MFGLTGYAKMLFMKKEDGNSFGESEFDSLFVPAEHQIRADEFEKTVSQYIAQRIKPNSGLTLHVVDTATLSDMWATMSEEDIDPEEIQEVFREMADEEDQATVTRVSKLVLFSGWTDVLDFERTIRDIERMSEEYGGVRDEEEFLLSQNDPTYDPYLQSDNGSKLSTWRTFHFFAEQESQE